jgi:hypothetical protein
MIIPTRFAKCESWRTDKPIGESIGICAIDSCNSCCADTSVEQLCEGRDGIKSRDTYEHDVGE